MLVAFEGQGLTQFGLRCGQGPAYLLAIDVDVTDPIIAQALERAINGIIGEQPRRIGNPPKFLLLVRTAEPRKKLRLVYARGAEKHAIEFLGEGQQFVATGIHPTTGRAYEWNVHPFTLPSQGLREVNEDDINRIKSAIDLVMDAHGFALHQQSEGGDREEPTDPDALKGDPQTVKAALDAMGNELDYDDWIAVSVAIKGALGSDEAAYEIYEDWCLKYPGNTPEVAREKWDSIKKPHYGADYLYRRAQAAGWGQGAGMAELRFDPLPPLENPTTDRPISFAAVLHRDPQPVHELVPGLIEKGVATFLVGPGGSNKSRFALQIGLCVNAGLPVLNQPTERARLVYLSSEDDDEEITRRAHMIAKRLSLPYDSDALYWDRHGKNSALALVKPEGVQEQPFYATLKACLAEIEGHKLVILDSCYDFARFTEGGKIDEGAVNIFVKRVLDGLCKATNSTLIVIWHPSQAGAERGDMTGWSVAWNNAPRARVSLNRVKEGSNAGAHTLKVEKRNHGPVGKAWTLLWSEGALVLPEAQWADEQRTRLRAVVVEEAGRMAAGGTPFTRQKHVGAAAAKRISEEVGAPVTEREVKDELDGAVRDGEMVYLKGFGRQVAGYYPKDESPTNPDEGMSVVL